jgi:hypothetical protein
LKRETDVGTSVSAAHAGYVTVTSLDNKKVFVQAVVILLPILRRRIAIKTD